MNRVSQILCLISNHSLACKILNKILAMEYYFDSNGHLNPASRGIIIEGMGMGVRYSVTVHQF